MASRKHIVYTHVPKVRNCEVCKRTKITRAPCRRRTGEAPPRAEQFGDLITADHKVLNEGAESRHNHRYSVLVQDFATQWTQSYQCKTKTSQETEKNLRKFLEPSEKPKVIFSERLIHWNLADLLKIYHGIIVLLHLIDRRRKGLPKEQCAE